MSQLRTSTPRAPPGCPGQRTNSAPEMARPWIGRRRPPSGAVARAACGPSAAPAKPDRDTGARGAACRRQSEPTLSTPAASACFAGAGAAIGRRHTVETHPAARMQGCPAPPPLLRARAARRAQSCVCEARPTSSCCMSGDSWRSVAALRASHRAGAGLARALRADMGSVPERDAEKIPGSRDGPRRGESGWFWKRLSEIMVTMHAKRLSVPQRARARNFSRARVPSSHMTSKPTVRAVSEPVDASVRRRCGG